MPGEDQSQNYEKKLLFCGNHGNEASVFAAFVEFHHTVDQSIERIVLAHSDILSGIVDGATLTHDDVAGDALLTTENLHA